MSVAYKKNGTEIPITSAIMGGGVEANPVLDGTEVALEGIKIDKIKYKIIGGEASEVEYDNTTSGMTADNVQDAIDEVFQYGNNRKSQLVDKIIAKKGTSSTSKNWDEVINDIDTIPIAWDANNDWEIARFQYTTYSSSQVKGYTRLSNKDGTITKDNQAISVTEGNDISISYKSSVWGFYSKKGGTYLYGYVGGSPSTYQWFNWQIITANAGELIHILPFDSFGQMICIKLS